MKETITLQILAALLILPAHLALAQQPSVQERVVLLKASLAAGQAMLKHYEPVTLEVQCGTLNHSAAYASTIVLEAKAKQLKVNVQNSGYRKAGH